MLLGLLLLTQVFAKLRCEELDAMHFFSFFGHCLMWQALQPGFSGLWGSPPALSSTLTLGFFFFFVECLGIQFFNSLTCDLWDTMPRQRSHTLIPREAEDFPRGDRHFKHVPPFTYLICLSPIELYMVSLFKPYGWSDLWRICSSWDLNSLHDKLSVLDVSCFIRFATEPYG